MTNRLCFAAVLISALGTLSLAAQSPAGAAGHWEGALELPDRQIRIEVDLDRNAKGEWVGAISIPEQGLRGYALSGLSVTGDGIVFLMKGIPGDPTFNGKLQEEGEKIAGEFTQGGTQLNFALKRTGAAKIEPPVPSTPITAPVVGTWEGAVEVAGKKFRLIVKLANGESGATGSLASVDQGGQELTLTSITQTAAKLKFDIKPINGSFSGELSKTEDEIAGTWTQHGSTFPLLLKRVAKPAVK